MAEQLTWPQTSQQAFNGQGFRVAMLVPAAGAVVPGFWGPQTAPVTGAGIGAVPELRQILVPIQRLVHPFQP